MDALPGLGRCELCEHPLDLPERLLHECTHCGQKMCLTCLKKHNKDVILNLKHIPEMAGIKRPRNTK